jgi:predicted metal-dependent peptidase
VSIDQSGSVSNALLEEFYAELNTLSQIASFTVVPFDTEVVEETVHEWKKGAQMEAIRFKSGGTDFNAPTEYVNSNTFDGHIILTDMCAPRPIASRCLRMWLTDAAGEVYSQQHGVHGSEPLIVMKEAKNG